MLLLLTNLFCAVASWQEAREGIARAKFWAVGKLSENVFLCRKMFVQKCKIWGLKLPHFGGNLGVKLKV